MIIGEMIVIILVTIMIIGEIIPHPNQQDLIIKSHQNEKENQKYISDQVENIDNLFLPSFATFAHLPHLRRIE